MLVERDELLRKLKLNLAHAKNRMAIQANKKCSDLQLSVGDKVLVKLQPYRLISVARLKSNKLGKRYFGPFSIRLLRKLVKWHIVTNFLQVAKLTIYFMFPY